MDAARDIRNLALVGFMGTGKSTVGRQVARDLHFEFVDTDVLIEGQAGVSIPEIFSQSGEEEFRRMEHDVVVGLAQRENLVIATGGGLVTDSANVEALKAHSLVVCLWANPETIWQRCRGQTHRPLLNDPEPQARIRELLAAREPHYRQADIIISTDIRPQREVVSQVTHQFRETGKGSQK
ncbi:MAG: hypothetical protein CMO66_03515 [Verrucomicrobiales bacterium]|nr:hypothetical protein [Verrucomicrobiales bacterium]|tara:strand:- start:427 stop:969 length:543 start_codon:yes stop_codon:yes gene_type:complete